MPGALCEVYGSGVIDTASQRYIGCNVAEEPILLVGIRRITGKPGYCIAGAQRPEAINEIVVLEGVEISIRGSGASVSAGYGRSGQIRWQRSAARIEVAFEVPAELHRQLQPAGTQVTYFYDRIAIHFVLHAEAPGHDLGQLCVGNVRAGQSSRPCLPGRRNVGLR